MCDFSSRNVPTAESLKPYTAHGALLRPTPVVQFLSGSNIVFAIGKVVVVQNVFTHVSRILQASGKMVDAGTIHCIAVSSSRNYLAVQRAPSKADSLRATVALYSMASPRNKQKSSDMQKLAEPVFQKIVRYESSVSESIALSEDGNVLCFISKKGITTWDWSRDKQIATAPLRHKVERLAYSPSSAHIACIVDGLRLQVWTFSEDKLRVASNIEPKTVRKQKVIAKETDKAEHRGLRYLDYIWLDADTLLALIEDNTLQLVSRYQVKLEIKIEALWTPSDDQKFTGFYCMQVWSRANELEIAVSGDGGYLLWLQVARNEIRATGMMQLDLTTRMICMALEAESFLLVYCTNDSYGVCELEEFMHDEMKRTLQPIQTNVLSFFLRPCRFESIAYAARNKYIATLYEPATQFGFPLINVCSADNDPRCILSHAVEPNGQKTIRQMCMDVHPSSLEILITTNALVQIFLIAHDSLQLALSFNADDVDPQTERSLITQVAYSNCGSMFLCALMRQSQSSVGIHIYRNYERDRPHPALFAIVNYIEPVVRQLLWFPSNEAFAFIQKNKRLLTSVRLPSEAQCNQIRIDRVSVAVLAENNEFCACTINYLHRKSGTSWRSNRSFVLFVLERSKVHDVSIRGWLNGNLQHELQWLSEQSEFTQNKNHVSGSGLTLAHDFTTMSGIERRSMLAFGSNHGSIMIHGYIIIAGHDGSTMEQECSPSARLSPVMHHIDLHAAAITHLLTYTDEKHTCLFSASVDGSIFVSGLRDCVDDELPTSLQVEPHQLALYDSKRFELQNTEINELKDQIKHLSADKVKLQSQIHDQASRFELVIRQEKHQAEMKLQSEKDLWKERLIAEQQSAQQNHEKSIEMLSQNSHNEQKQHNASIGAIENEVVRLRLKLSKYEQLQHQSVVQAQEREEQMRAHNSILLGSLQSQIEEDRHKHAAEVAKAKSVMNEALAQVNEEHLQHLSMLSAETEMVKRKAENACAQAQGQSAGLHQELKLLLDALNQKDQEIKTFKNKNAALRDKILTLSAQCQQQEQQISVMSSQKSAMEALISEQSKITIDLERMNIVYQSHAANLQSKSGPTNIEIEKMQNHMALLHNAHEKAAIAVCQKEQARVELHKKLRKHELEIQANLRREKAMEQFINLLFSEWQEIIKQLEKVHIQIGSRSEALRQLLARWTKMWQHFRVPGAKAENVEIEACHFPEQNALEWQNDYLLRSKGQLQQQLHISMQQKHRISANLTQQNTILMHELNSFRKEKKELERKVQAKTMAEKVGTLKSTKNTISPDSEVDTDAAQESDFQPYNGLRIVRMLHRANTELDSRKILHAAMIEPIDQDQSYKQRNNGARPATAKNRTAHYKISRPKTAYARAQHNY